MAMSGPALSARIVDIIIARAGVSVSSAASAGMRAMWDPICTEIVNEVRRAQVSTPGAQPGQAVLPGTIVA